ncbi:MAG: peptidase [Pseudonocardiales bacterium]|nr:MAG: peptidase [Pseudonocardiales bacterium]
MTAGRLLRPIAAIGLLFGTALASCPSPAGAAEPDALVRGAHFSPDTPGVDVYLTAFAGGMTKLWLSSVGYGDVSAYQRVTPGMYAVAMRPHGAAASTPAALSWTLKAGAGRSYTAAAVGMNKQLKGIVLRDELAQPRAGTGSLRVIQAASMAPHVDVMAQGGPAIARAAAFATQTTYTAVPAGRVSILARSLEKPAMQASAHVTVAAGSIGTVVVLDTPAGGITLHALLDAAGASAVPVGSVPAGGGGTAAAPAQRTSWLALGVTVAGVLAAVAGLALWVGSRRRA